MPIVKILVPVTGASRDAVALKTAIAAAKPFNAHVEILCVQPDPREAIPYAEVPLTPDFIEAVVENARKLAKATERAAHETMVKVAHQESLKIVNRPERSEIVTLSFRNVVGHLSPVLADEARLADLVVFPPITKADTAEVHHAFIRILTGIERPILLCADVAPAHVAKRIALGWDGRGADANALIAALPYLARADQIELVSIKHPSSEDNGIDRARDYLALHGISCSARLVEAAARTSIAEELFKAASDAGCDMLVVGGYGHSRLRETIFGGVTASIVSHPQVPVLMVH